MRNNACGSSYRSESAMARNTTRRTSPRMFYGAPSLHSQQTPNVTPSLSFSHLLITIAGGVACGTIFATQTALTSFLTVVSTSAFLFRRRDSKQMTVNSRKDFRDRADESEITADRDKNPVARSVTLIRLSV